MIVRSSIKAKKRRFSFYPDFICESIVDVDFRYLKSMGIKACLIDLDGTVVSRGTYVVDQQIRDVLRGTDMDIHIATNRPKSRSLKTLKEDLNANSVIHPRGISGKPTRGYYANALRSLGLKPKEVVMIGDRYFQDLLGANRAGIYSLLVYKLGDSKGKADEYISRIEHDLTMRISPKYKDIPK